MWSTLFIGKQLLAADIWEFRFARPEHYSYLAGQYAQFKFPDLLGGTQANVRTMSLTSLPNEDVLTFITRVPAHPSPFKQRLITLKRGEIIMIDTALGDLILPRSAAVPIVFVAGGIGIASFVSMLKEVHSSPQPRTISLLYALRTSEERLFAPMLATFPFSSYGEFIAPDRVNASTIIATANGADNPLFYLSGTERFVEGLRHDLIQTGLNDSQIVFDYFTGYDSL